jgi:hypothetical protein
MKYIIVILLVCLLVLPAMAMIIEEPTEGKITESPTIIIPKETILPEDTLVTNRTPLPILLNRELFKKTAIQYNEKTTLLKKITMKFDEILGLKPVEESVEVLGVDVVVDDMVVAIIPTDSKFNGVQVHEYCLEYQYGTTQWFNCEQELL